MTKIHLFILLMLVYAVVDFTLVSRLIRRQIDRFPVTVIIALCGLNQTIAAGLVYYAVLRGIPLAALLVHFCGYCLIALVFPPREVIDRTLITGHRHSVLHMQLHMLWITLLWAQTVNVLI